MLGAGRMGVWNSVRLVMRVVVKVEENEEKAKLSVWVTHVRCVLVVGFSRDIRLVEGGCSGGGVVAAYGW